MRNSRLSKSLKAKFRDGLKAALPSFERIGSNFGGAIYRKTDAVEKTTLILPQFVKFLG
jgi:hypothetical protein